MMLMYYIICRYVSQLICVRTDCRVARGFIARIIRVVGNLYVSRETRISRENVRYDSPDLSNIELKRCCGSRPPLIFGEIISASE